MKPALTTNSAQTKGKPERENKTFEQFEDYLSRRDYTGAITFLEASFKINLSVL